MGYRSDRNTEIDHPKTCRCCGKKTGKFYEWVQVPIGEPYTGNAIDTGKRRPSYPNFKTHEEVRITRNLWLDWGYGSFCTARCAIEFANAVVDIGRA
tara:strand:- start:133 stop:423 length:291 start_codon:yes stop_codon:yes gene_type:complete